MDRSRAVWAWLKAICGWPGQTQETAAEGGPVAIVRTTLAGGQDVVATSDSVAVRPTWRYVAFALGLAAVGYAGGLLLQHHYRPELPKLATGVSVFALLYIFAQSIERLLVPVSWVGGGFLGATDPGNPGQRASKKDVAQRSQAATLALALAPGDADSAQRAADASHEAEQYAANLTATSFGVASAAASLVAGYSGALLLATVGIHTNTWLDLLVTSLAIAGGTKPLSDLVANISKKSDSAAGTSGT
jgi:hypothetical protein